MTEEELDILELLDTYTPTIMLGDLIKLKISKVQEINHIDYRPDIDYKVIKYDVDIHDNFGYECKRYQLEASKSGFVWELNIWSDDQPIETYFKKVV